ncbi:MAG TPA: penicillin acylase family protein, partial [Terriglobales bacterium]|nr:penicillin acylase family protein [Terriglobales bacterium]
MNAGTFSSVGSPRRRTKLWRAAALVAIVLFCLIAIVLLWLFSIAHSALPQIDGTVAVAGLSAPVNVTRDAHGVPTIDALTVDDLFFAQGYVTAQDRLFQMDLLRRASKGELAEIVGKVAVKHDRQQRILGIRATADKAALVVTPEDRDRLTAYARGVNAYIESHRDHLPLEFRILRYSPAPWTLADSLAVAYQMVETLSTSPKSALTREKILAKLGPQLTADLYVNNSWRDHPPTMPLKNLDSAPSEQPERSPGAVASSNEAPE